ncbi:3',5'-cyclic-AMP phosphodiesterase [Thermoleptolyngbya oregonensis NK1-22]|uniref:3',5'-cyclic-AMP phosphodiesterase n=1 Tax=Thermoleptolyngbya oregonensis NK1-22 TaxID=2547457 RepID=A0AA96Y2K1_9CYAN|nr:3',5'-cyclic-AMP phosphodiesterase [Thermoleptolyngbya oregonensis]WOB42495.1 3',5'-cyclic-AMP phosphodiesterase [Thermoleptolyngbya oregonensis NK1-22]
MPSSAGSPSAGLKIVQLTDTHLFADEQGEMKGCQTGRSLQVVLQAVAQRQPRPDLLLLTGDLSQDETEESYRVLLRLISPLGIPALWLPGNHDQAIALMEQVLSVFPASPQKCLQQGGWNLILLNSSQWNEVSGRISDDSLRWLDAQLCQFAHLPTLVALHHPPLAVGSAWMDAIGLQNREDLFAVLDQHPQVKLVVFGHIHQEFDQMRQGVRYLGTPSTCVQFSPNIDEFSIDSTRQPGFREITLYPDGRYETQVVRAERQASLV